MYVIDNMNNQMLLNQGHMRVVLPPLVHILIMPLHILGSNGFGADLTFGRVVPISKMVAEILLAIALKITVWVVVSWTPERAMTVLNAFPSNRPVEAVTSAVRVRRGLVSQDLSLSVSLRNEETAVNRLALLC